MSEPVLVPPSPRQIRADLEAAVIRDLLGPAGGPEEEIAEAPRERYLLGMLAPRRQILGQETFDELAVAGEGAPEDGGDEGTAPPAPTMFPSSFGLTFAVDGGTSALRVIARWGRYERTRTGVAEGGRDGPLVWKRRQVETVLDPFELRAGSVKRTVGADYPDVYVQGRIRRQGGEWIITLFLVNGQQEQKRRKDEAWLFQPEVVIEAPDGAPAFRKRLDQDPTRMDPEDRAMAMLYRRHVEFAVGHGVSVHADLAPGTADRATRVATRIVPAVEIGQVTSTTAADVSALAGLELDMRVLAETTDAAPLVRSLSPLVEAYGAWITAQAPRLEDAATGLSEYRDAAQAALTRCSEARDRIRGGLELLGANAQAVEAFRFMNRAMWLQRVRSLNAERVRRGEASDLTAIDVPDNRSWYPFQLAFILLNLPALTDLRHPDRSAAPTAVADLLWFPTGGGKTEAYLGLTAYTLAIRRLQGTVAGRAGELGIAVLMRYTLRLLTLQQFQRAAALLCACEVIRREDEGRWGKTPFRIGLWVGRGTTPNTTEQSAEALRQAHGAGGAGHFLRGVGSPAQLTNCPWCGARIEPGRDIRVETYGSGRARTLIFCGDPLGRCDFTGAQAPGEGLPVVVVDEEVYRLLPSVLIATVDKFAQMPWRGETQMLFGQVDGFYSRPVA